VDPRESARLLAKSAGADLVLGGGPDLMDRIRQSTGGRGADVVVDLVGSDQTLASGAACARQLGDLTIVGLGSGTLPMWFLGVPYEVSVQTTYWGNRSELVEVLDLASRGLLVPAVRCFDLEEAATAYELLAAGDIEGHAVITPHTAYTGR
jgi:alcohol dehydrogenase, propanol-preferring